MNTLHKVQPQHWHETGNVFVFQKGKQKSLYAWRSTVTVTSLIFSSWRNRNKGWCTNWEIENPKNMLMNPLKKTFPFYFAEKKIMTQKLPSEKKIDCQNFYMRGTARYLLKFLPPINRKQMSKLLPLKAQWDNSFRYYRKEQKSGVKLTNSPSDMKKK